MVGRKSETVTVTTTTKTASTQSLPTSPKTPTAAAASSTATSSTSSRSTTPTAFESLIGGGIGLSGGSPTINYQSPSSSPNISPVSIRTAGGRRFHHNNGDNNSLLGVIVDRSSFDEDDELTTFGGPNEMGGMMGDGIDSLSVGHEHPSELHMMMMDGHESLLHQHQSGGLGGGSNGLGGGGVVMRNGKVRRKLRWKPRFGGRRSSGSGGETNFSSNVSVLSAMTNRSVSTSRSTSTTRSFLSHFSRRSNTSFHTFHSTETPVATNKANRPQAPHTVMRPNYPDSFDVEKNIGSNDSMKQQSTIDNEGRQSGLARRQSGLSLEDQKLGSNIQSQVGLEQSSKVPDRLNDNNVVPISPRSPISESSPMSSSNTHEPLSSSGASSPSRPPGTDYTASSPTMTKGNTKSVDASNANTEKSAIQFPPKSRRPPLFKRRLRNRQQMVNSKESLNSSNDFAEGHNNRPPSPTDASQTSSKGSLMSQTAPTASLSASISLDREHSILPVLSGDEYEEHRRVSIHTTMQNPSSSSRSGAAVVEEEKKDGEEVGIDGLLMEEEGIEESSLSPTVADQSIQSRSAISLSSALTGMQRKFPDATTGASSSHFQNSSRATGSSFSSIAGSAPQHSSSPVGGLFSRRRAGAPLSNCSTHALLDSKKINNSPGKVAANPALPHKQYNRPVDSSIVLSGIKPSSYSSSSGDEQRRTRNSTVPADVDEGAFLEAEHNLRAIHEMAAEHLAHGEYEEAIDVFEEILRGQQERYGQDHYRVGTALHNLGIVYLRKGDYERAIEICCRAVQVRKEALVPNHPDVAVSLAQLGVAYLESDFFHQALEAFQDALHIRRNFLGPRHPKCAKILNNIGCALYSMEEYTDAKEAFSEALDIQRDTLRHLPSAEGSESNGMQSNALLLSMASTLCNIGSIHLRWGDFDHAVIALDEALLVGDKSGDCCECYF